MDLLNMSKRAQIHTFCINFNFWTSLIFFICQCRPQVGFFRGSKDRKLRKLLLNMSKIVPANSKRLRHLYICKLSGMHAKESFLCSLGMYYLGL